jgi:hypothetical protein
MSNAYAESPGPAIVDLVRLIAIHDFHLPHRIIR